MSAPGPSFPAEVATKMPASRAERKPTVRVIEKRAAESVAKPPSPADERTTEDKKKALLDKMKRGGKPSWLKR